MIGSILIGLWLASRNPFKNKKINKKANYLD